MQASSFSLDGFRAVGFRDRGISHPATCCSLQIWSIHAGDAPPGQGRGLQGEEVVGVGVKDSFGGDGPLSAQLCWCKGQGNLRTVCIFVTPTLKTRICGQGVGLKVCMSYSLRKLLKKG